ncbi:DUF4312 family protein [Brevibacillus daliensis]|uniref:DUF4312 family protein n=1 Tax=Brevibacillus daliensis TaxID=2892995 RepID=UPI001E4314B8|nr:DUF4312 family protein [Brevibacillus daliensis]
MREFDQTMTLTGVGETKEAAFNQVFSQIKNKVSRESNDIIFRIEPVDIEVLSASVLTYKERFLGIFFPRTRTRYTVKARVSVRLCAVELSKIDFKEEQRSTADKMLGLKKKAKTQ